jgi:peptide/nickel transport system ATP-binding protein
MSLLLEMRDGGWSSCCGETAWRIGPWSFQLGEQGHLLLDGPSGAGKSLLLLRCLGRPAKGLEPTGQLLWRGAPLPAADSLWRRWARANVRWIPQQAQSVLSPARSIAEQWDEARQLGGWSPIEEHILRRDLELTEWSQFSKRFPCQISGGQAQRLVLALALLERPNLLLLDEPSSALHRSLAQALPEIIRRHAPQAACIWATHDQHLKEVLEGHGAPRLPLRRELCPCVLSQDGAERDSPEGSAGRRLERSIAKLQQLQVGFGERPLPFELNKTLVSGRIIGWWGPSGTGKTSLARVLVGLNRPVQGRIEQQDRYLAGDRRSFLAFQNPYACFASHLTIGQQLEQALRPAGHCSAEQQDRILTMLLEFGLSVQVFESLPAELSGGQLQRCALVRALLIDPELLILDEPTSALDEENRQRVARALRRFASRGRSTLCIISHDRAWLESIADEIWDLGSETSPAP